MYPPPPPLPPRPKLDTSQPTSVDLGNQGKFQPRQLRATDLSTNCKARRCVGWEGNSSQSHQKTVGVPFFSSQSWDRRCCERCSRRSLPAKCALRSPPGNWGSLCSFSCRSKATQVESCSRLTPCPGTVRAARLLAYPPPGSKISLFLGGNNRWRWRILKRALSGAFRDSNSNSA